MSFLASTPKVKVTKGPTDEETQAELLRKKRAEEASRRRAFAGQSRLGAEQLRGGGSGLNLTGLNF